MGTLGNFVLDSLPMTISRVVILFLKGADRCTRSSLKGFEFLWRIYVGVYTAASASPLDCRCSGEKAMWVKLKSLANSLNCHLLYWGLFSDIIVFGNP